MIVRLTDCVPPSTSAAKKAIVQNCQRSLIPKANSNRTTQMARQIISAVFCPIRSAIQPTASAPGSATNWIIKMTCTSSLVSMLSTLSAKIEDCVIIVCTPSLKIKKPSRKMASMR